jgi:putative aldouronate transport system permease protein
MITLCVLLIVPFILIISISLSNEKQIIELGYSFIPRNFELTAYEYIFKTPKVILSAYNVTTISTVVGTFLSVFLMALIAYPLSKPDFHGRKFISFYIFFTMIFNGGLVPTYILISQYLKLNDTIWVFIIPGLINAWHVFLLRTFFSKLPESIVESALIDGAGEFRIFFSMIIPLSTPVLATVALFGALARWNDWFTAMLYINNDKLLTLQYLLQKILLNIQTLQQQEMAGLSIGTGVDIPSETVRMAMAIVAAGPMLLVFPFFQKYFVQGLTMGSVKG